MNGYMKAQLGSFVASIRVSLNGMGYSTPGLLDYPASPTTGFRHVVAIHASIAQASGLPQPTCPMLSFLTQNVRHGHCSDNYNHEFNIASTFSFSWLFITSCMQVLFFPWNILSPCMLVGNHSIMDPSQENAIDIFLIGHMIKTQAHSCQLKVSLSGNQKYFQNKRVKPSFKISLLATHHAKQFLLDE